MRYLIAIILALFILLVASKAFTDEPGQVWLARFCVNEASFTMSPDCLYVDGGIRDTVPLRAVIEDVDEVDVIITSTESGGVPYQHKFKSAVDVGLRAAFIMSDEVMVTDRIQAYCGHHDVKVNIYAPNAPLRFDGFEFTQDAIGEMFIQGFDETKAKLNS